MNNSEHAATILVVDDEPAYRSAVGEVLRCQGYQAIEAGSAAEALKLLDVTLPDLILLDVMMPGVDGLTLLRFLASDPRFLNVPLIMATAKAMASDRYEAWERGASAYLTKPFTYDELTSMIEYWLKPPESEAELIRSEAAVSA